jgi:hypothetical protein
VKFTGMVEAGNKICQSGIRHNLGIIESKLPKRSKKKARLWGKRGD